MRTLSRGIDYLGDIGSKLRDLQGFATLASELIQNADDAPGATELAFDVRKNCLVVDNDGVFSACDDVEADECGWLGDRGHNCDFHRFRNIASGDKREESGTTGAFGIGFISVYQITDHPELISSDRHWILREENAEAERIQVCGGCPRCREDALPGTRFVLPWALDPESEIRRRLRSEEFHAEVSHFLNEVQSAAFDSLLFLKRVVRVTIRKDGREIDAIIRQSSEGTVTIKAKSNAASWWIVEGEFEKQGEVLRDNAPRLIESKRSTNVAISVPLRDGSEGRLFACLPTQQKTGLTFHINADFFPRNDRKGLVLEQDIQSGWNRAAIQAVGTILRDALCEMPARLQAEQLWSLLSAVNEVSQAARAGKQDKSFITLWETLAPSLASAAIVKDSTGNWQRPSATRLVTHESLATAVGVVAKLGIHVVAWPLRRYQNLLTSAAVGVKTLGIGDLSSALTRAGYNSEWSLSAPPGPVSTDDDVERLQKCVNTILAGMKPGPAKDSALDQVRAMPLAPTGSDRFSVCGETYRDSARAQSTFGAIDSTIRFLVPGTNPTLDFRKVCPEFTPQTAVVLLQRAYDNDTLKSLTTPSLIKILEWLAERWRGIQKQDDLVGALKKLPIVPTTTGPTVANEVALPGDFKDPFGFAGCADPSTPSSCYALLRVLGVKELDVPAYVKGHIPRALQAPDLSVDVRRQAVQFLAEKLGSFRGDADARNALSLLKLVECEDGSFATPDDAFFPSKWVTALIDGVPRVAPTMVDNEAVRELYRWLGVSDEPGLGRLKQAISNHVSHPPTEESKTWIGNALRFIQSKVVQTGGLPPDLEQLRSTSWLPGEGTRDRWYRPDQLFTSFRRHLFGTQGKVLDQPRRLQGACADALSAVGVKSDPNVETVVRHLLAMSASDDPVSSDVYRFLSYHAGSAAIIHLRNTKCLNIGRSEDRARYVRPADVFWSDHPFATLRYTLRPELAEFKPLLDRLGVKNAPEFDDAIRILIDVSEQAAEDHDRVLSPSVQGAVEGAWRILNRALVDNGITDDDLASLEVRNCVVDRSGAACQPSAMLLDDRPGVLQLFDSEIHGRIMPRRFDTWLAQRAAGVRLFSDRARVVVDSITGEQTGQTLYDLLVSRIESFDRLGRGSAASALTELKVVLADGIRLHWKLRLPPQDHDSLQKVVEATYDWHEHRLLVSRPAFERLTPSLAREVATMLWPDVEAGRLSFAVGSVLAADSPEDATTLLDEMGVPTVAEREAEARSEGAKAGALGGESDDGQSPWTPPKGSESEDTGEGSGDQPSGSGAAGQRGRRQHGTRSRSSRYPVYVGHEGSAGGGAGASSAGAAESAARSATDSAAIRAAMRFEVSEGRRPEEMEHSNPGFDIKSHGSDGQIQRYIEVKGLSGPWDPAGVGLTRPQFEAAEEQCQEFWLYVVENATSNPTVHLIQNPAGRANRFFYDNSWRAVAESREIPESETDEA